MTTLTAAEILSDIRMQQSSALFIIALSIVTFIAGIIIRKTGFLNPKGYSNKDTSFSRIIGKYMIIFSLMIGFITLFAFLLSFSES